jgi:hypothetical protein
LLLFTLMSYVISYLVPNMILVICFEVRLGHRMNIRVLHTHKPSALYEVDHGNCKCII